MGVRSAPDDKAAREEKALRELTNRLVETYTGSHSQERVESAVGAARSRFDGTSVRDFVPILVERMARRDLENPPEISAETAAAGELSRPGEPPATESGRSGVRTLLPPPWTGRRLALPVGALAVVVAVAAAVGLGGSSTDAPVAATTSLTTVSGVVGSEKAAFFTDPHVVDVLARNGLRVEVDRAGSRQIATTVNLGNYDFAFPSSGPAAERILRQRNTTAQYTPFSSPMTIATFRPIADLLTRAGVVRPGPVPTFDMNRYLDLTQRGTQWDQLPGNTEYPVRKSLLISTTDPRTSNSAAMYLAAAAYVANDNSIVRGRTAEEFVVSKVSRLFTRQGFTDSSSEGPFAEYLSAGMGPTPMVWSYEAQFVEAGVQGRLRPDMTLLYPSPTVLSRHTLVPLTSDGDRIGRLLSTDPELQRLAAEHGFRPNDGAQFAKVVADHQVPVASNVVDVVDTPAYDTLEHLLDGIAESYN
ncbi:three-helix bundle dimerization domain-containing protein [Nocardia sp. N2S4-5]|uniref:three-helix bundle dimerization domain-containing protein n=1 Tax=Nocardia sp. N2S4-5 TaxID=3351565 RepID=UPI0037D632AA